MHRNSTDSSRTCKRHRIFWDFIPDSTNTRLSAEHKTKDAASRDLEKSKAKPTPTQVRFEEDIMQVFIRGIFVRGQEKTLVLEVEKSDTVDDVKSKILKEMGIPKDMQKLHHACLSLQDDEILSH